MEKLEKYKQKRNLEKSGEPLAEEKKAESKNLAYVVQHHIASHDHYDLRLEWDGVMLSWAVPKGPSFNPADKRLAIRVENHPLDYRHFEGTIPKGEYGGGDVMLWDNGFWTPDCDVEQGLKDGTLKFSIQGKRLKGEWALVRLDNAKKDDEWLLIKEKDRYSKDTEGISGFRRSVKTGRTMDEIDKGEKAKPMKNPISNVSPQLAKLVTAPPETEDWIFEVKYDGYRILAYCENGETTLLTRNGKDYTKKFFTVAETLNELSVGRAFVLDGEMVVADEKGRTDFQALQNLLKNKSDADLTYVVFDLLALDGVDLRSKTVVERKRLLENLTKNAPENICYSVFVTGGGSDCVKAACAQRLEGIVGKKVNSTYRGNRNGDWIKIKCDNRQEFVVGGYTRTDKKTDGVSALLLGVYDGGKLVYSGRAGTGFSEKESKELAEKFEHIKIENSLFSTTPKTGKNEKAFWIKPQFVAEVKFAEWTKENLLRQASYKGMRADKNPLDVKKEKADAVAGDKKMKKNEKKQNEDDEKNLEIDKAKSTIGGIKISNPDRLIFPKQNVTKFEVAEYYATVAQRMLPFVGGRILSIVRCPKGVGNDCFFKKHYDEKSIGIEKIPIKDSDGEEDIYFYIANGQGLIWEAQMGTIEFHTWGSRADSPNAPDMMVFDLDPDEGMELAQIRQGVKDLKKLLDSLSLASFLKTSGGKGYHVVVPVKSADWDKFHDFAKKIAQVMEGKMPTKYTSNIKKASRKGKIFIDWERNGKGATSVAPYSLRARDGAKVSMPIVWKELGTVAPDGIDMAQAVERLKKPDPWQNFFSVDQSLKF
ncbi:MAG TPA: DNA ligase D [Clostridia bacterium]|nr:DNA ligase D [Clostridia bacterium]